MPEAKQLPVVANGQEEDQDEFKALWTDAKDGAERLAALATAANKDGKPDIAAVYRELSATVMSLIVDLTMATGGAVLNIEEELEELDERIEDPETVESTLLAEDAEKYLQLFDQYVKLLDGLANVIPPGDEGDAQREIFATLRRMTEGMMEFTRTITADAAPEEADPADPDDEEEEEDDD